MIRNYFGYAIALIGKGDWDEALAILEEGLTISEKVGDQVYHTRLLNTLGWLCLECGDLERAIDLNQRAADRARKRGDPELIGNSEINLADSLLAKGDPGLALELLTGVLRLVKDPTTSDWMKWRYSTRLFASLGEVWLARGEPARADEFAGQCLEIATRTNSRKHLVRAWRLKGEIAMARRRPDGAAEALHRALAVAQAIGNPTQLWRTHFALGRLYTESSRPQAAREAYRAARDVIDRVEASLRNPGLRASFESAVLIRKVYELGPSA
jgi:tetratricopeptide (TPR) repeat protein